MWLEFKSLPLVISLLALLVMTMLVPAMYGLLFGEVYQGRTFLYAVLLGSFSLTFIWLAVKNNPKPSKRHTDLWSLLAFFIVFPIVLAVPFQESLETGKIIDAYLDLVSVITTTGLKVYPDSYLTVTLVVWRVCLGWICGFLMWVFAWSIFAPLNLGGFELLEIKSNQKAASKKGFIDRGRLPSEKFWSEAVRLAPIYIGITVFCSIALLISTREPGFAVLRAMSTVATFGIYLPGEGARGFTGELILVIVMMFALSRATFSGQFSKKKCFELLLDREFRLGLAIFFCSTIIIFCLTLKTEFEFSQVLKVLWGACFTSISFLTTTGLVSEFLPADFITFIKANLILSALAMFGGGVATTAGGIKLLRIYILSIHCKSEVYHLLSPARVITGQNDLKVKNYNNAMLACVFFMVFILSFALITLGLSLTGSSVNEAATLTLGTITNTGPIIDQFKVSSVPIIEFEFLAKIILVVSMVLGRIEVLALLALLNPDIYS